MSRPFCFSGRLNNSNIYRRNVFSDMPEFSLESRVAEIRNADVSWDNSFFGWLPTIHHVEVLELASTSENVESLLLACLKDPDRFAIAHVLLGGRFPAMAMSLPQVGWNGLHLAFDQQGAILYDPQSDIPALHSAWLGLLAENRLLP